MKEPLDIGVGDLVILRSKTLVIGMVIALDLGKDHPVSINFCTGETIDYKMSDIQVISAVRSKEKESRAIPL